MKLLYLTIDFFSLLIPFVFSFHTKIRFYKEWKHVFPAILISAIPFIIWDIYFTDIGVWGFTSSYLTGYYFFNLPIEEVLFFICIPYSCLFTYHCFKIFLKKDLFFDYEIKISSVLLILLFITAFLNYNKLYTFFSFSGLIALMLFLKYVPKVQWLGRFYFTYLALLIPFSIVNGLLTGTGLNEPVVWYNNNENIGIRVLTIPAEDIFYGMLLILLNTTFFEYLSKSKKIFNGITY